MMRGMFAAISGLKVHQTMLDVAANDIANVNTVGYKGERDELQGRALQTAARRQRRRRPTSAAPTPPQVGLGVQLGSIDNDDGRRRASSRPATRSTWRSRATASSASPTATAAGPRHGPALHARRQLHARRERRPRDPGRPVTSSATPVAAGVADRHRDPITVPAGGKAVSDRHGRRRHLHRRRRRPAELAADHAWRSSRTRRASSASRATASATRPTPAPPVGRRARRRRRRHRLPRRPARSRCRTSTSPRSSPP